MTICHKRLLGNGLRLVAVEMPHLHSTELAVYIKVGGRNDPPGKEGLSHFLEHMLFRGTADYPTTMELETAFEAIGGSVNASTDEESTCYFSRVHPDHVAEGIDLFSSMLLRPTLSGLEIEKRIIIEEALEDINEQGQEINTHNLASRMLWPGHPLGAPTIGYLDSISGYDEMDLRSHMAQHYVPQNAVIVMAGKLDVEKAFTACEKAFQDWAGSPPSPAAPAISTQSAPQSLFVEDSDSQVHLLIAFRGLRRSDERLMAARLIRRILCGGGSSRLHLSLRERLGIVYSVDASISAYEETGSFAIELSTAPENVATAAEEVLKETARLASEPLPKPELDRIRQGYFFDLAYSRDSTYEMQVRFGWGELMDLVRSIEEDHAEAAAVATEAICETARILFAPHHVNLVAVGPCGNSARTSIQSLLSEYASRFRVE
ncbi:pitrilysin family protein [Geobacter sp. DSM 9736]|uniref:M16 family metallopeptidase n=1 Tax=Geobacter sp. DSM 9736 TaxID=1277350 RepID=UPI000B500056|nr:pitrilysin family protein [Geobacter sp. DSM 9736]SNB47692.1 Predicted Zn-dependent peptidase [Geobacter sp. DSM 9736]